VVLATAGDVQGLHARVVFANWRTAGATAGLPLRGDVMAGKPRERARTGRAPAVGARGYSWVNFDEDPDHAAAVATRHGVWSKRRVDPLTAELAAGLLADRPDLERYPETVLAWARAEARCVLLADWVAEHGLVTADGETPAPLRYVAQFERLALNLRSRLGLDPRSEIELVRESAEAARSAVDLDALRERGRAVLDAREAP